MRDEWALIDGFGGRYRVSRSGQVQSCCSGAWRDLSIGRDRFGYQVTYLWDSAAKARVRRLVHQLVAAAFIPKTDECVNHKNGVKTDNRADNLEWCSRAENLQHAWETGLCKAPKLTPAAVRVIRSCGGSDTSTAAKFGVSQVMVSKIRARKAWASVPEETL
jgi:hypothetical protein